ncbi:MAG TPA: hypothetical protein VF204_22530, partial [Streptosporangiaceae bacterium]
MRRYLSGLAALSALAAAVAVPPLAAAPAAAAASVTAAASAALATAAGPVTPAAAGPARAAGPGQPLLLLSGQRVMLRPGPDGRLSATDLRPSGLDFSLLIRISFCGRAALIPAAALPFLGRGLDPSLFLVRSLQQAEHGGRLPVRLSWSGARRPALPGVRITRAGPGSADGYLTARSARAFGAALIRQARADQGRASYGTDGLFAHGLAVRLAGAPAPARPSRPHFVQHTLTVRATSLAGRPDTGGSVTVFNADDCMRFGDPFETGNVFRNGTARFSVPSGHYWAFGDFLDFSAVPLKDRIVILPQFTVTGDTTVAMAVRSATSLVSFRTPLPSVTQMTSFGILRTSPAGTVAGVTWAGFNAPILVSPTATAPTVGGLQTFTSGLLTSPKGAAPPYAYSVDYPAPPGLVPAQGFDVSPQSLATVHERYFQDVPSRGQWTTFGGTAAQSAAGLFGTDLPVQLPGLQTQYLTGAPGVVWASMYAEFLSKRSPATGGGQNGAFQEFAAGQDVTQDWNRYPLHPAPSQVLSPALPDQALPAAARSGNLLELFPVPFSDNQPGHTGSGFIPGPRTHPSGRFTLTAGRRQIAAGRVRDPVLLAPVPSAPSLLRFTLTARRAGPAYPLSGASRTVWTWRSAPDPQARVPASWLCVTRRGGTEELTRRCAVQPMMTLAYLVHGLGLRGIAPAGPQVIDVTAGHLQLSRAAAVTGAAVAVSFDGGAHWQAATVTRQGTSQFRAAFTAPPGALVTLRVTAKDAAGGSISDTIQRAYRTGAASAGRTAALTAHRLAAYPAGPRARRPAEPATMTTPACARPRPGRAQCDLRYQVQTAVNRAHAAGKGARPRGWGARALEAAYRLPVSRNSHQTVAVSIPFRIPHLA